MTRSELTEYALDDHRGSRERTISGADEHVVSTTIHLPRPLGNVSASLGDACGVSFSLRRSRSFATDLS